MRIKPSVRPMGLDTKQRKNTTKPVKSHKIHYLHIEDRNSMYKSGNINQQAHTLIKQGNLKEAKSLLLNAHNENNEDAEILLGLGIIHAQEGDLANAEKWLKLAVDKTPELPDIHIHLANLQSQLGKADEAIAQYQAAIACNPDIFEAHYHLAGLLLIKRQIDDAEYHYLYAMKLNPGVPGCHINLAQLYELTHRLDEARNAANQALSLSKNHPGALMLLGKIEKRYKHYAEAEKLFAKVLELTTDESQLATVKIELGQILDRMGQYDNAWDMFSGGKQLWQKIAAGITYDSQEYQKNIQENYRAFSHASIRQWKKTELPVDIRPAPVFFVGFPRSGTTLTEQILAQYPNSVTSNEDSFLQDTIKSISTLLDSDMPYPECLQTMTMDDIVALRGLYWRQVETGLDTLKDNSLLIDKLPLNIVDLGFVARVFPDAKILVAIRDPRDCCLSCYTQAFQLNPAMTNFLSMESTVAFYTQVMSLWLHYRSVLPIKWHQFRYEDLVDDFDNTTTNIFSFLELELPDDLSSFYKSARNKFIKTNSYQDVTTPIYNRSKARWKNYEKHFSPYLEDLKPFLIEFSYQKD